MVVNFDEEGGPVTYIFTLDSSERPNIALFRRQCCRSNIGNRLL
jgi:hypothetical protein